MKPIPVNKEWQLFLDNHVIARSTGFSRVLHHPRPRGVVLPADKPWETYGVELIHGTPVGRREDGTFYAFYRALWWDPRSTEDLGGHMKQDRAHHMRQSTAYAISEDGIHWTKPNLGLVAAPAGTQYDGIWPSPDGQTMDNNIGVPITGLTDLGTHGNVSAPQRRYVFRVVPDPGGAAQQTMSTVTASPWEAFFSPRIPDFAGDPNWRRDLIPTGGSLNPRRHYVNFWDPMHEEWVALEQGCTGHWLPSREIARFASKDLVNWTSEAVLYPDADDPHSVECHDEPMVLHAFCAEGIVFGLLSWFHSDRSTPDGGPVLEASPEHPVVWPWVRKGLCEIRITISRDGGKTWDRTCSRQAWIPHSTDPHAPDRQTFWPAPPVRVGDEDWFYVTVMNGDHLVIRNNPGQDSYYHDRVAKLETALYTQLTNRYVSMRVGARQAEVLITRPVVLEGAGLEVNVDASCGEVRVAIAPAEEQVLTVGGAKVPSWAPHLAKPLAGFGFDDCQPIRANSPRHAVRFAGDPSLRALAGRPVYLLFRVYDAELFGFRCV